MQKIRKSHIINENDIFEIKKTKNKTKKTIRVEGETKMIIKIDEKSEKKKRRIINGETWKRYFELWLVIRLYVCSLSMSVVESATIRK